MVTPPSCQPPATRVRPVAGAKPALAVAEGQVVEISGQEAMAAVVDDVAVVEAGMEAVSQKAAAGDGEGVGRGAAGVGEVAGEGVAGVEGERLAAVARDLDGAAGVVAEGGIGDALDNAPAGIGTVIGDQRAVVGDAGAGGRRCGVGVVVAEGVGGNLVEVDHGFKILAVAAGVREAHADAVAQVLLEGQVPLLHGGVFVVDGKGVVEAGGSGGAAGGGVERIGKESSGVMPSGS